MFSLIDLKHLFESAFPTLTVNVLEFPVEGVISAIAISMDSSSKPVADTYSVNVQVQIRDDHPMKCEKTSQDIRKYLQNKTNISLGSAQVVLIQPVNPVPLYLGKDGNGNYLYSNNYTFIINEGGNN